MTSTENYGAVSPSADEAPVKVQRDCLVSSPPADAGRSRTLNEDGWQTIETVPKDGSVIRVKNGVMVRPVLAQWGRYKSQRLPWLPESDEWVLVEDEGEEFMPLPPGTLVCPTHWQPAASNQIRASVGE